MATDPASVAPDAPKIDGRRTLVIGLGSTGARVCNQILDRVTWEYGAPTTVPWLSTLVLETAPVGSELAIAGGTGTLHLTINESDFTSLIKNPQAYQDKLAFPSWNIPQAVCNATAIKVGAQNIRILGRLALLFPANFAKVESALREALQNLGQLQGPEANAAFGSHTHEPLHVRLSADTFVYVVGTLCGGTASGCFVDVGYLLRSLPGFRSVTTGMFLLPADACSNQDWLANAYAALVELNHFSSDNASYEAQFPNTPGKPYREVAGTPPYEHVYLVQPRGASKGEYAQSVTALADYIYSDLVGSAAGTRDGARTNVAQHFMQVDYWGATQKFFTFGQAAVEFPVERVEKACLARFGMAAFEGLLSERAPSRKRLADMMELVPLCRLDALRERLYKHEDTNVLAEGRKIIQSAVREALATDHAAATAFAQLRVAMDGGDEPAHPKLRPRIISHVIEDNATPAAKELQNQIREALAGMFTARHCSSILEMSAFLNEIEKELSAAAGELESKAGATAQDPEHDIHRCSDKLAECRRDFWLGLTLQRAAAVLRFARAWGQVTDVWFTERLGSQAARPANRALQDTIAWVKAIQRRIGSGSTGLECEARRMEASFTALLAGLDASGGTTDDGWSRHINGKELFEPQQTVKQEFESCLRAAAEGGIVGDPDVVKNRIAGEISAPFMHDALGSLLADAHLKRRYDSADEASEKKVAEAVLLRTAAPVRPYLTPIRERSVISRLLECQDYEVILSGVKDASDLFLGWSENHPRFKQEDNKRYGFVFYDEHDPQAPVVRESLKKVGLLAAPLTALNHTNTNQILVLREQGAFSLGTINAIQDDGGSHWRYAYETKNHDRLAHSRGDIDGWITWDKHDIVARDRAYGQFLCAVSVGVLRFVSAGRYALSVKPHGPVKPPEVTFTNDLAHVEGTIKRHDAEADMRAQIAEKRDALGDTEFVDKLMVFLMNEKNEAAFTEAGRTLTRLALGEAIISYILHDSALTAEYQLRYPHSAEIAARKPDETGEIAYFCTNPGCGKKLGYTVACLYIDEPGVGGSKRVRKCSYCHQPIQG